MIRPAAQIANTPVSQRRLPRPRRQRSARHAATLPKAPGHFRSRHSFLLLIVLIAQGIFFTSSLFQVQQFTVAGLETIQEKQVLKKSELQVGKYLWQTTPGQVAQRVAQLQNVQTSHVAFYLPGRVHITVQERQPAYQVSSNGLNPTWYAVDREGLVLRKLKGTSNQWPRLKLEEHIEVGKRLHPALIATCSQACRDIERQFPASIWYYTLDQRGNLSFRTFSKQYPVDVQLGSTENLSHKLQVLQALMSTVMEKDQVSAIDLRFATPVVRLLNPPKPKEETAPATS